MRILYKNFKQYIDISNFEMLFQILNNNLLIFNERDMEYI